MRVTNTMKRIIHATAVVFCTISATHCLEIHEYEWLMVLISLAVANLYILTVLPSHE